MQGKFFRGKKTKSYEIKLRKKVILIKVVKFNLCRSSFVYSQDFKCLSKWNAGQKAIKRETVPVCARRGVWSAYDRYVIPMIDTKKSHTKFEAAKLANIDVHNVAITLK